MSTSTSTLLLKMLLPLTFLLPLTTATVDLASFQTITGFSQSCMRAYYTPITGCNPSDFQTTCSSQCLAALGDAQATIITACTGQAAAPDTVIGQFFQGDGASFLCGGALGKSSSSASSTVAASSTTSSSSTTASISSASSSTSETSSKSTPSTQPTSSITSSTLSPTSPPPPSSSSSSSPPTSTTPTFLSTAANNGVAETITSEAQRTDSSNPDAFGGGGSPFEVAANNALGPFVTDRWAWTIVCLGFLGGAWVVG